MCGIVGCVSGIDQKELRPTDILVSGLQRLEYRGYDSAGVALLTDQGLEITRAVGRLENLKSALAEKSAQQAEMIVQAGIGHTRWATHGRPTEVNAHPHQSGDLALVQNGIVENYQQLKTELAEHGYQVVSETDTEVVTHLLHYLLAKNNADPEQALPQLLEQADGGLAIVAIDQNRPDQIMVARRGSPLVIGVGDQQNYVASDVTALLSYTREFIYLENNDYALISAEGVRIFNSGSAVEREVQTITWDLSQAERDGYAHFMLKEIFEQPKAINDTFAGRLVAGHQKISLHELEPLREQIKNLKKINLVACGTAWHACLLAQQYFEQVAGIPVRVETASEFRYQPPIIQDNELLICVSQSGETADTLAAAENTKELCPLVAVTNVLGSTLSREADAFMLTHAGPEISVASTKAFLTQAVLLKLTALYFARIRGTLDDKDYGQKLDDLTHLSGLVSKSLLLNDQIKAVAQDYAKYQNYFFVGRGITYPIALEGALKLKEITYYPAQGYPTGELKHGPIALIDEEVITVAVLQSDEPFFSKSLSNLNEVKARDGKIIVVTDAHTDEQKRLVEDVADEIFYIPHANRFLMPILATVALQLYSYHLANALGREIDFPRNLAKSVTVE